MKRKYKVLLIIYFILIGIVILGNKNKAIALTALEYIKCGTSRGIPKPIPQLTTIAYTLLTTAAPIVLVVFSIIELIKSIMHGNSEDIFKSRNKLFKKFIIAAIIFLTASIVQFVFNRVTSNDTDKETYTTCLKCFLFFNDKYCIPADSDNDVNTSTNRRKISNLTMPTASNRHSNTNSTGSEISTHSSSQIEAIRKIFYAIETGGQVYGNARYDAYIGSNTNSSNEKAITIGAGQWYANEARDLLKEIYKTSPNLFSNCSSLVNDLNSDWSTYDKSSGSATGKCIIKIISSDAGKRVQDNLMDKQINEYLAKAQSVGINDIGGQVMYAEIMHCGGSGAAERIRGHATTPYTAASLYKAVTSSWPDDAGKASPINGSMYRSRHDCVYKWINQYVI